jgi:hypothetical protein
MRKRFKGWDFTEVIEHFKKAKEFGPSFVPSPVPHGKVYMEHEDTVVEEFRSYIFKTYCQLEYTKPKKAARLVSVLREYLDAVIRCDRSSAAPIWGGLKKIEHNETFLKYFMILFQCMWT